jgi:hypothetical protein
MRNCSGVFMKGFECRRWTVSHHWHALFRQVNPSQQGLPLLHGLGFVHVGGPSGSGEGEGDGSGDGATSSSPEEPIIEDTAFQTFNRPPVMVLPFNELSGSTLFKMYAFMSVGLKGQVPPFLILHADSNNAAAPETCGQAMLVPSYGA